MATLSPLSPAATPTVGGEIKKLRQGRGLSLRGLAALAHVHVSSLSRWEAGGRTPALPELDATLAALAASEAQKRAILRLMDAPRALVRLRALDETGTEAVASGGGGDLLWAMRKRRGWTQAEVARAAGIAQAQVAWWERGEAWPDATKLHTLCWVLHAAPEEVEALTRRADRGRGELRGQREWRDGWGEHEWGVYVSGLLSQPPPDALADLAFIGIEQTLAQRARLQPFAATLLPDVYAIHARHHLYRNKPEIALRWAERGFSLLRQRRSWQAQAPPYQPLWFGNVLILSSRAGQGPRPARLRQGVKMLRDWLPALERNEVAGSAAVRESQGAHYAWGQMALAQARAMLGQTDEAVRLGKEACLRAERLRPSEGFMRWRDYADLLRRAGQPAHALKALAQSQAQVVWEWASPDTVARHTLIEARCLDALDDTAGAREKAREAEQLIASHDLRHLQNTLHHLTDTL